MQVAGLTLDSDRIPGYRGGAFHAAGEKQAKKESRKSAAHQLISRSDCFDLLNPLLLGATEVASRRDNDRFVFLQPVFL